MITTSLSQNTTKNNQSTDDERMLRAAIGYAELLNWHVFPVHSVINGKCTCRNVNCSNVGKHPVTRNGLNDATIDISIINDWWTNYT